MTSNLIQSVQGKTLDLCLITHDAVNKLTSQQIANLVHACDEHATDPDFSMRTACDIIKGCCQAVIETRRRV